MGKKVLITPDVFHHDAVALLEEAGFEVAYSRPTRSVTEEELQQLIADADVYVPGANKVRAETIAKGARLKLIARFGVGYDAIDIQFAKAKGIPVTFTPDTLEPSVADMAFALLLSLSRRIPFFNRIVREGSWVPHLTSEVWSKTIGIIGTGRIGKEVAKRAKGFDMNIVAFDEFPNRTWADSIGAKYVPLEQLLSASDYVTLHLPLTEKTRRIVNASFLKQMKPAAYLINTSRGPLVDEQALYEALASGTIAGAGLDVFEKEPVSPDHPLLTLENVIVSAHVSSSTHESMRRMSLACAEEILRMNKGLPPLRLIPEHREG